MTMKRPMLLKAYPPGWKAEPGHSYFTLHQMESDISRLRFDPKHGTVLDPSLPREFTFEIYERSVDGYCGHCASYGQEQWQDALTALFDLAHLSLDSPPEFKGDFATA
jgi:hypothetical protein